MVTHISTIPNIDKVSIVISVRSCDRKPMVTITIISNNCSLYAIAPIIVNYSGKQVIVSLLHLM